MTIILAEELAEGTHRKVSFTANRVIVTGELLSTYPFQAPRQEDGRMTDFITIQIPGEGVMGTRSFILAADEKVTVL